MLKDADGAGLLADEQALRAVARMGETDGRHQLLEHQWPEMEGRKRRMKPAGQQGQQKQRSDFHDGNLNFNKFPLGEQACFLCRATKAKCRRTRVWGNGR